MVHPHVAFWQHDVLGERPVAVYPEALGADAQMASPGPAITAGTADDVTLTGHLIADPDIAHAGTYGDHLAAELMADYERCIDGAGGPVVPRLDVQVSAADAGAQHADLHFAGTRVRLGPLDQLEPRLRGRLVQRLHVFDPATPSELTA